MQVIGGFRSVMLRGVAQQVSKMKQLFKISNRGKILRDSIGNEDLRQ